MRSSAARKLVRNCLRGSLSNRLDKRVGRFEALEDRRLLAVDSIAPFAKFDSYEPVDIARAEAALAAITTTGSHAPLYLQSDLLDGLADSLKPLSDFTPGGDDSGGDYQLNLNNSTNTIKLNQFRAAAAFAGINGAGFSTVVIDTGLDLDHPHFGPDANSDGIADRIVFQQSFVGEASANDSHGHGTHVTGIVGSQDTTYTGMAPGAALIGLQTIGPAGGNFSHLEQALQWVVNNAQTYNIASVNMSLSDNGNHSEAVSLYGIGDELEALAALDVIVVSASGNSFATYNAVGVGYPSADPNSLSIGNRLTSSLSINSGSQRHPELSTVFAPGTSIVAARAGGGTRSITGTSMSSPHVAGIAVLMQQLAVQELGRRLTLDEFDFLVRSSGFDLTQIPTTGAYYQSLDVLALGNAILAMKNTTVDLTGTAFNVPSGLTRGDSGLASFTVSNAGSQAAGTVTIDVYVSSNDSISATGDLLIGTTTVEVGAGAAVNGTVNFELPEPNDPFWGGSEFVIGMIIDSQNLVGEASEGNNLNQGESLDRKSVVIGSPPSDLRGVSLVATPVSLLRGESVTVQYQVENVGLGPALASQVAFYLSADATIDPATDRLLATDDIAAVIGGGADQLRTILLNLPVNADPIWAAGTQFTLGMVVDSANALVEVSESNNTNRGFGLDMAALTIEPPPTRIEGFVFNDADNNGDRRGPFAETVSFTRAAGGVVDPQIVTTLEFTDLPPNRSGATLRVQAYGDLEEVAEFATITIDGFEPMQVFDKEPVTGTGVLVTVDETLLLHGPAWETAMLDGSIAVNIAFTNPGSITTSPSSWVRLTLSYGAESLDSYHVTRTFENRVLNSRGATASLPATMPPVGDGVLTLVAMGRVGALNQFANVSLEGLLSFTMLDEVVVPGTTAEVTESVPIPLAALNTLLADGNLQAAVTFSSAVDGLANGNFFQVRLDYPVESELGMAGVVVNLDIDDNGTVDAQVVTQADDPATSRDETGRYQLVDIGEGLFGVDLIVPADWQQTTPASGYSVSLIEGAAQLGFDFGIFSSDVNPPVVDAIYATSTQWNNAFIASFANGIGYPIQAGGRTLPWRSIDRLVIQFSEGIGNVSSGMFELRNSDGLVATDVSYDPLTFRATVMLAQPMGFSKWRIAASDTLVDLAGNVLDGDQAGGSGGILNRRFDVAIADADGDGRTGTSDLQPFAAAFNRQPGEAQFNAFANWNGDNRVNTSDLQLFGAFFNQRISVLADPGAPFGGGSGSGFLLGMSGQTDGKSGAHDSFFSAFAEEADRRRRGGKDR